MVKLAINPKQKSYKKLREERGEARKLAVKVLLGSHCQSIIWDSVKKMVCQFQIWHRFLLRLKEKLREEKDWTPIIPKYPPIPSRPEKDVRIKKKLLNNNHPSSPYKM